MYENFIFWQKYAFALRCCVLTFSFEGKLRKYDISVKREHTKTNESIIFSALFTNFRQTKITFFMQCRLSTSRNIALNPPNPYKIFSWNFQDYHILYIATTLQIFIEFWDGTYSSLKTFAPFGVEWPTGAIQVTCCEILPWTPCPC